MVSVVVRYEFDCDFLDLFEVKSQSFGERDLAFAKTITPLRTSRRFDRSTGAFVFDADGGGFAAECRIEFSEAGVPGDRACDFEVTLPARCAWSLDVAVLPRSPEDGPPQRGTAFLLRERTRVRDSQQRFADSLPDVRVERARALQPVREVAERPERAAHASAARRPRLRARGGRAALVHGAVRA